VTWSENRYPLFGVTRPLGTPRNARTFGFYYWLVNAAARIYLSRQEEPVMPAMELRPNCECCDRDLPPDAQDAVICSFECTFCRSCAETVLGGRCPNCGGEFVRRPVRPAEKLVKYPASRERKVKAGGCAPARAA
jgi:hypothetical protein